MLIMQDRWRLVKFLIFGRKLLVIRNDLECTVAHNNGGDRLRRAVAVMEHVPAWMDCWSRHHVGLCFTHPYLCLPSLPLLQISWWPPQQRLLHGSCSQDSRSLLFHLWTIFLKYCMMINWISSFFLWGNGFFDRLIWRWHLREEERVGVWDYCTN